MRNHALNESRHGRKDCSIKALKRKQSEAARVGCSFERCSFEHVGQKAPVCCAVGCSFEQCVGLFEHAQSEKSNGHFYYCFVY